MKNENQCFFSISLENGITITANNPNEVHDFLHEMHSAFYELCEYYKKSQLENLADSTEKIFWQIADALDTIHNNQHKERE